MEKDLLAPRYEVVNDYPDCPFEKGDVLDIKRTEFGEAIHEWMEAEGRAFMYQTQMNLYPHLFRKLHWADKREVGEMPEYVKPTEAGELYGYSGVLEVAGWSEDNSNTYLAHWPNNPIETENFLPATLTEYTEYLKNK